MTLESKFSVGDTVFADSSSGRLERAIIDEVRIREGTAREEEAYLLRWTSINGGSSWRPVEKVLARAEALGLLSKRHNDKLLSLFAEVAA